MSEQVATAQPETQVSGGEGASPETSAPVTQEQVDLAKTPDRSVEDLLSDIWDKNHAPSKAAPQQAAPEPVTDQPEIAAPEPAQSSPAIEPPQSWSAEARAEWSKLPPTTQAYIAQRESDAHKAITRTGSELKAYEPLRPVLQALNQHMGVPQGREAEVITSWARAQAFLDSNPTEGLKWLAQSYGVDLAKLAGQNQPASQQPTDTVDDLFRDPRLDKQVMPEVDRLRQENAQVKAWIAAQENGRAEQYAKSLETAITDFSKDKPFWNDLQADVVHEVRVIKQASPNMEAKEILAKAYERAKWANEPIRNQIIADQRKAEQDSALKEAARNQAHAKKMQGMNVRTGAAASTPAFDGRWNDDAKLSALYDRIQTGGR